MSMVVADRRSTGNNAVSKVIVGWSKNEINVTENVPRFV